jgi:hypothetical protein
LADGVREQDAEESIWTKEGGSNRWLRESYVMRNLMIISGARCYQGGEVRGNEIGRACVVRGEERNV